MVSVGVERGFAIVVGAILIALGLLGSVTNPLIGRPDSGAILTSGAGLDLIHVVTGALSLHVGLALNGRDRANGIIALGVAYLLLGIVSVATSDLFGVFGSPTGGIGTIVHVVLGVAAAVVGWMGRGGELREVGRRVSRPARG